MIGLIELTKAGTMNTHATFRPFTVYACLALMYLALCRPITAWRKSLERKLQAGRIHEIGPPAQLFGAPQTAALRQFLSALDG